MNIKSKQILLLIIAGVLLNSTANAIEIRKIQDRELVESEYGILGDIFGIGDRLYKLTYVGGETELVVVRGGGFFKATITQPPETVWGTEMQPTTVQFRAKAPNLVQFLRVGADGSKYATHKFELYLDDTPEPLIAGTYNTPNPLIDSAVPVTYSKLETFVLPATLPAGTYYYFIKEYVQDISTGQWVAGASSYSSESRFTVVITTSQQSTPASTPSTTTIRVDSNPSGARVTADGGTTYLGTTPFDLKLNAGESKILTFTLSGYNTQLKGMSSTSGSPFIINMNRIYVPEPTPTSTPAYTPEIASTSGTAVPATTASPTATPAKATDTGTGAGTPKTTQQGGLPSVQEEKSILDDGRIGFVVIGLIAVGAMAVMVMPQKKSKKGRR
jgi:hypothetical protein